jgi:murein DD-endopeptidase MepM/ murein hydrolase activator NlpD
VVEVSATGLVTALAPGVASVGAYSDQSVGFARVVVQMDFRLPVSGDGSHLRSEMGTPTALCPGGEGGLRFDGGRECAHAGISRYSLDFMADEGLTTTTAVVAAADGVVTDVCRQPPTETTCGPNGPFVYIEHGFGFATFYSHLDPASISVRRKTPVVQGEALGSMGTWGAESYPWMHFELRYNNQDPGNNPVLDELLVDGRTLTEYRVSQ